MGVNFGGFDCLDPVLLRDQLALRNLPADFWGKPNSYECPTGPKPGTGWLLLTRAALTALMPAAVSQSATPLLYNLTLTSQEGEQITGMATIKGLLIVDAVGVAPGLRGDADSPFLVRIADRRWLYQTIPVNKAYNVVLQGEGDATGNYLPATLNSGQPWTWQQIVNDLWTSVSGLGTAPTLPVTPQGTPENFDFYGGYALQALEKVLNALGCTLVFNPLTNAFAIAQVGVSTALTTQALAKYDALRVWDDEPIVSTSVAFPASVTVAFLKDRQAVDTTGASPYYTIVVTDPQGSKPGTQPGTSAWIWDSELARYDINNNLQNGADLLARANQCAANYYRTLRQPRLRRVYGRALADKNLMPGGPIAHVRWGDRGRGVVTELTWHEQPAPDAGPAKKLPLPEAWIKVTSTTPVLIALAKGGVLKVWHAVIDGFVDGSASWADGSACWWYEINGQAPDLNGRYQCRLLCLDACNSPVWATEQIRGPSTTTTAAPATTTTTTAPCAGTCYWVWSPGTQSWQLQVNGCVTSNTTTTTTSTTTTTATPGTTTCNPIVTTTTTAGPTTTTVAPLTCGCLPPTYCGTFSGECTITNCATGLLPPSPNCASTTTTAGPTTTTTANPACSTTISPSCTQCCWVWNGMGWAQSQYCVGVNCFCPSYGPTSPGNNCGDVICYSCYPTTPPPPGQCLGNCHWIWITPPGYWFWEFNGCGITSPNVCGPCLCQPPTIIGSYCLQVISTPCLFQCATTPAPCVPGCFPCPTTTVAPNPCGTGCYWSWDGSKWVLKQNSCISPCNCCAPGYQGTHSCETAHTDCFNPPSCPTTTTSTTTVAPTTTTTPSPCGNCTFVYDSNCRLLSVYNGCTGSCGCPGAPSCPQAGGTAILPCATTTTTAAPCGTCTYLLGPCEGGGLGLPNCLMTLTGRSCTGSCGCCAGGCTMPGYPGQVVTVNCSTGNNCPTTTTPAPNYCYWVGCGSQWCLWGNGCPAGYQCSYPSGQPDSCCNCSAMTPCLATTTVAPTTTTTSTTTTTLAPTCGTCTFKWISGIWTGFANNCTGLCNCQTPTFSGTFNGQLATTNCA